MLKLSRLYFLHLVLLLGALFLFISIVSYYGIKTIEIQNFIDSLQKEILLIENSSIKDPKVLDRKLKSRITIIDLHGKVLAESRFDKEEMENHLLRPEVQQALRQGWGWSERYSTTLHQNFLYVAKKSGERIIRLAYPLKEIKESYLKLWLDFLLLFLGFALIALVVSYFLSRKIQGEIDKIVSYLEALSEKEYAKTITSSFSAEFAQIAKHLQILAKKLQKREEKKAKYTKKIKQIAKQRNELISAISHEFKNPVAIINGYAQTLLQDNDMPTKLRQRFIQKIYDASQKISAMIDRLALAMKFENENLQLHKSRFCLCELTKEVIEFLPANKRERVRLQCHESEVYADRQMIEIAITNLIDNALKYSELPIEVVVEGGRFCVRDQGVGIKEGDIEKITKKFYRVSNSWDNSMGLGLFIVSYILKLHATRLEIESEFGEGSSFCFQLTATPQG